MNITNKVILMGHLGADPEMVYFENGDCIANASLATTSKWKDNDGKLQEKTQWHKLVFRNAIAETIQKHTAKGSKLYVEGSLNYRTYTDANGHEVRRAEIMVGAFEFAGERPEASAAAHKINSPELEAEIKRQREEERKYESKP
jgi:single-strand DNA-binding protein